MKFYSKTCFNTFKVFLFITVLALGFTLETSWVSAQVCDSGSPCQSDTDCTSENVFPEGACPDCFVCENGMCLPGVGCTQVLCGDGELEEGEECDDGANNSNTQANACRLDCTEASCGDGVVDSGEECDGAANCDDNCESEQAPPPSSTDDFSIQGSGGVFSCALNSSQSSLNGDSLVLALIFLAGFAWKFHRRSTQG